MRKNKDGYYIQTDKSSCGPISIMNSVKWKYGTIENNDIFNLNNLRRRCRTTDKNGSTLLNIALTLEKYKIGKNRIIKSNRQIKNQLKKGNAIILHHEWHFSFVFLDKNNRIRTINNGKYYYALKWERFFSDCVVKSKGAIVIEKKDM
jgi:hypothetical protein